MLPDLKSYYKMTIINTLRRDFFGGLVVKTLPSNAGGMGSIPGQGAKISHASRPKKSKHKTETVL